MNAFRRWKRDAIDLLREYIADRLPKFFIPDDLAAYAWRVKFPEPDDNRWWGQVLQEAADLGLIRRSSLPGHSAKRRHKTSLWFVNTHA